MENKVILPQSGFGLFLTFNGDAEAAMNFYQSVFPGAEIVSLHKWEKGMPNGDEGKVLNGILRLNNNDIVFMDMQSKYPAPQFNWAHSLFYVCPTEELFDQVFNKLKVDGNVMMGPEPVMDMRKCTWVTDKFGVTWQLVWH